MELEIYENHKPKKNSLSIRLAESAVFLSTDVHPRANRDRHPEQRSTLLRGLLILHLVKPTKITSIEVELTATASTAWPEGIGARRVEVNEVHRVFHASTLYFRASAPPARRIASIGPGIYYNKFDNPNYNDDSTDWDNSSHTNEAIHTPTTPTPSEASRSNSGNEINTQRSRHQNLSPTPSSRLPLPNLRSRRVSADYSQSQRISLHEQDEGLTDIQLPPIPPYSPLAPPVASASSYLPLNGNINHPPTLLVPGLEDVRHWLYNSRGSHQLQSRTTSPTVSRRQSVIPEDDIVLENNPNNYSPTPRLTPPTPSSPTQSSPTHLYPLDSHPSILASTSQQSPRGRKRFTLSAVTNVIIDAVRSSSPRTKQSTQSRERGYERVRDRSMETTARERRGRTMERGSEFANLNTAGDDLEKDSRHMKERGRGIMAMMLGDRDKEKAATENWKEFKKGTYTFPISFSIPGDAPPTMMCDYGSVCWRLKASVHRPGTFNAKMTAVREVITIACPAEGDTEDTESIIVERHWEQQLQYVISISGRSFYVGGTVPVTFTLMPLAKISIYRLSVYMEERVDYYTSAKRIGRTDPISRFPLLSIKGDDNHPILPLQSDDPNALRHSPLFAFVNPGDDISEVASNLMGPGPWTIHQDLKLPDSCSVMKFTNKNRKSNITVTHTLKLVMRVERGDNVYVDGKTGKRKLFDIVVQTPVLILSCRCNPEWTCLPRYSEVLDGSTAIAPSCPCRTSYLRYTSTSNPVEASRPSIDSYASVPETSPANPSPEASLRQLHRNEAIMRSSSLFERLVSGQESVSGEVPPAYNVGLRPATNGVAVRN